ncbi:unnamed protein product [Choristocarpus tenellus]|uniref:ATP synthase CF1, subunit delta n=1 Tax=Choristocarpus tenellus TaxID=116065 RepID=UPI002E75E6F5|nr:ATP synthase CF1, subunit delta [Choristocarpus tenellus]WAM62341.1 ATP synthase CF1, subunit delta [Choristocarpus tenellus]
MTNTISGLKIAQPYADALFQLGLSFYLKDKNSKTFFQIIFDMQDVHVSLKTTPILKDYLLNPLISNETKKSLIEKCLHPKATSHTKNFLKLLVDKKRIGYINLIADLFLEKIYDFFSFKFVEVCSIHELTTKQQKLLLEKLQIILSSEFTTTRKELLNISLVSKIDPDILGGFVITIGSKIIDLSLLGQLQDLAKHFNVKF